MPTLILPRNLTPDTTYSEVLSVFKRLVPIPTALAAEDKYKLNIQDVGIPFPLSRMDFDSSVEEEHQEHELERRDRLQP